MIPHDTPRFIDVAERRLAMRAAGHGAPTIALEMGLGAAGGYFDRVLRLRVQGTR